MKCKTSVLEKEEEWARKVYIWHFQPTDFFKNVILYFKPPLSPSLYLMTLMTNQNTSLAALGALAHRTPSMRKGRFREWKKKLKKINKQAEAEVVPSSS